MSALDHPWTSIDLDVYETHMSDAAVAQLPLLRAITGEQLGAHPSRTVGVLGVAGGNGLDLVAAGATDSLDGYDVNRSFLDACEARYRTALGDRLHLVHAAIDRSLVIRPVELLIANLVIEYVGVDEFAAFASANIRGIGVLSCVVQRNDHAHFVSETAHSAAFDALTAISHDIDVDRLVAAMSDAGFTALDRRDHPLPNAKTLVRQDFRPTL